MAEFVPREEFKAYKEIVSSKLGDHSAEIGKLREKVHEIANIVAGVQYLKLQVGELVDDLKNVPRKEDLNYVTAAMTESFKNLEKERFASERRLTRNIAIISLIASVIISVVVIIVNAAKH